MGYRQLCYLLIGKPKAIISSPNRQCRITFWITGGLHPEFSEVRNDLVEWFALGRRAKFVRDIVIRAVLFRRSGFLGDGLVVRSKKRVVDLVFGVGFCRRLDVGDRPENQHDYRRRYEYRS